MLQDHSNESEDDIHDHSLKARLIRIYRTDCISLHTSIRAQRVHILDQLPAGLPAVDVTDEMVCNSCNVDNKDSGFEMSEPILIAVT